MTPAHLEALKLCECGNFCYKEAPNPPKKHNNVLCKHADMVLCTIHKMIHKGLLVKAWVTGAPLITEDRCLDQEVYGGFCELPPF